MFREMLRKNKQIPLADCVEILKAEKRGVLSVLGDDDYPYGMPMNHFYHEEDGCIYFHCSKAGHRLDALRRHEKASFCVYDQGVVQEGGWALQIKSVIVFGRIEIINDLAQVCDITNRLSHKFTQDEAYIQQEIEKFAKGTLLLRLKPEHICGKFVTES